MQSDAGAPRLTRHAVYLILLAIQTGAATVLVLVVFPLFQQVVTAIGQPQQLPTSTAIIAVVAASVMQVCYWLRYHRVPVAAPVRGAMIGHLILFASRASFFFSGAVFSAIFFRHVPQLDVLPPMGQGLAKAAGVMALLFASFCYALELERLGRVIEEASGKGA